eukprot:7954556-Pyramimonas_sp.AAC.1
MREQCGAQGDGIPHARYGTSQQLTVQAYTTRGVDLDGREISRIIAHRAATTQPPLARQQLRSNTERLCVGQGFRAQRQRQPKRFAAQPIARNPRRKHATTIVRRQPRPSKTGNTRPARSLTSDAWPA